LFAADDDLNAGGQSRGEGSRFTKTDDRVVEIVSEGSDEINYTILKASHTEPVHDMNDPHLH
jgi:hypothetical protein